MHRFEEKRPVRIWGLGIAVALIVMAGAVSSSCVLGTKTNFCEQFGLRCREGQECAANQAVCVDIGGCGNGVKDRGEICDDGNIVDGEMDDTMALVLDSCNHDCTSTQRCGNGFHDIGEACDEGERNGAPNGPCDLDCRLVSRVCGNGTVDQNEGEQCDPGPMDSASCNSNMAGPASCKSSSCGDGYTNKMDNEECDSGGIVTDKCNGFLCTEPRCGDHFHNPFTEKCDTGEEDTRACNGPHGVNGEGNCLPPRCGDNYLNKKFSPPGTGLFEVCDDGNDDTTDLCPSGPGAFCQVARCGDRYIRSVPDGTLPPEECDNGDAGNSDTAPDACRTDCRKAHCGDGVIDFYSPDTNNDDEKCEGSPGHPAVGCSGSKICNNDCTACINPPPPPSP